MAGEIIKLGAISPISQKPIEARKADAPQIAKLLTGEILENETHEKSPRDNSNPQADTGSDTDSNPTYDTEDSRDETVYSPQNEQRLFHFDLDYSHGEPIVNVVDAESHQILRQIPFTELQSIKEKMPNRVGIFIDSKA